MRNLARVVVALLLAMMPVLAIPISSKAASKPRAILELAPLQAGMKRVKIDLAGVAAWMILDTGGGVSFVGPRLAAAIGCQPYGRITGFRQSGERTEAAICGSVTFGLKAVRRRAFLAAYDVGRLLPPDWPKVDGLLALPAVDPGPFTIDWSGNRIILASAASLRARIRGKTPGAIRLQREIAGRGLISGSALFGWLPEKLRREGEQSCHNQTYRGFIFLMRYSVRPSRRSWKNRRRLRRPGGSAIGV